MVVHFRRLIVRACKTTRKTFPVRFPVDSFGTFSRTEFTTKRRVLNAVNRRFEPVTDREVYALLAERFTNRSEKPNPRVNIRRTNIRYVRWRRSNYAE